MFYAFLSLNVFTLRGDGDKLKISSLTTVKLK